MTARSAHRVVEPSTHSSSDMSRPASFRLFNNLTRSAVVECQERDRDGGAGLDGRRYRLPATADYSHRIRFLRDQAWRKYRLSTVACDGMWPPAIEALVMAWRSVDQLGQQYGGSTSWVTCELYHEPGKFLRVQWRPTVYVVVHYCTSLTANGVSLSYRDVTVLRSSLLMSAESLHFRSRMYTRGHNDVTDPILNICIVRRDHGDDRWQEYWVTGSTAREHVAQALLSQFPDESVSLWVVDVLVSTSLTSGWGL